MAVDTAEKEQCRANTLKGERCKNKAKDDSGLCGTHLKMAQKQADAQQGADSKPAVKAEQGSGGQTAPPGARKYTTAADAHSTNGRPPPAPSTHPMVTRSKAAAELVANSDVVLLPAHDSVTNAMGSGTKGSLSQSKLPSAKQHWINCVAAAASVPLKQRAWPGECCAYGCTKAADRGGHVFITGKFRNVYIVPVCASHNKVEQFFKVKAGTVAVQDPTISVWGLARMAMKHLVKGNFTLLHTKEA